MRNILLILSLCCCSLWAVVAQTYKVGDLYTAPDGSRGIVYYVFPDNSGGWVVALNDASTGCAWGTANDVPELENRNSNFYQTLLYDTAGYANTQTIRNYQGNSTLYAAGVVDFAHGWVLPSPAQISVLYGQLPFISTAITSAGGTSLANEGYWCSAELDASNAWRLNFDYGNLWPTSKTDSRRVRAVRTFTNGTAINVFYAWSTGAITPTIAVTQEETTTYTVTVSSTIGCTDVVAQTIVVNNTPPQTFYDNVCQNREYVGNGFIVTAEETSVPGVITRTRTVTTEECNTLYTLELTVLPFPGTTITSTVDTACLGTELILNAVTSNIIPTTIAPNIAVGDILCTDGSIVKPKFFASSGKVAQGVVFYVDNTGEHGWAVHLQNQSLSIAWGGYGTDIPSLYNYDLASDAITDMNGYSNTQKIRAAGNATTYPAAYAVDFENGWYIPAVGQLNLLFANILAINPSLQTVGGTPFPMDTGYTYMSSTEHGSTDVWFSCCSTGAGYHYKNNDKLRSIRDF